MTETDWSLKKSWKPPARLRAVSVPEEPKNNFFEFSFEEGFPKEELVEEEFPLRAPKTPLPVEPIEEALSPLAEATMVRLPGDRCLMEPMDRPSWIRWMLSDQPGVFVRLIDGPEVVAEFYRPDPDAFPISCLGELQELFNRNWWPPEQFDLVASIRLGPGRFEP